MDVYDVSRVKSGINLFCEQTHSFVVTDFVGLDSIFLFMYFFACFLSSTYRILRTVSYMVLCLFQSDKLPS